MNKRLALLSFVLFYCSSIIYAYNFEVDGVYYSVTDSIKQIVEVTHNKSTLNTYKLERYTIPNQVNNNSKKYIVNRIGDRAFFGCDQVVSVYLPKSIISIGNSTFAACKNLSSIHLPNSILDIDVFAFSMCEQLEFLVLPSNLDSLSDALFAGCTRLKQVRIPDGVTYIGQKAFFLCSNLDSISIPKSVKSLEGCATFLGCSKLSEIEVYWLQPIRIHPLMIEDIGASKCKLVVPKGMVTIYSEANGWKDFKEIEESK